MEVVLNNVLHKCISRKGYVKVFITKDEYTSVAKNYWWLDRLDNFCIYYGMKLGHLLRRLRNLSDETPETISLVAMLNDLFNGPLIIETRDFVDDEAAQTIKAHWREDFWQANMLVDQFIN